MNAFVTDHGHRCRQQSGHGQEEQANLEREGDVCGVQPAKDRQEDDDFGPRFGRWFVEQTFLLQLFPKIRHWMCCHELDLLWVLSSTHAVLHIKVVFGRTLNAVKCNGVVGDASKVVSTIERPQR